MTPTKTEQGDVTEPESKWPPRVWVHPAPVDEYDDPLMYDCFSEKPVQGSLRWQTGFQEYISLAEHEALMREKDAILDMHRSRWEVSEREFVTTKEATLLSELAAAKAEIREARAKAFEEAADIAGQYSVRCAIRMNELAKKELEGR